jgi:hypothetical protein
MATGRKGQPRKSRLRLTKSAHRPFSPRGGTIGICDHQSDWRIAAIAKQALPDNVALVTFQIRGWRMPTQNQLPERPCGCRLPIEHKVQLKQRTIAEYVSQTRSRSPSRRCGCLALPLL